MRTLNIKTPLFHKFLTAMVIIAMMLAALPVQAVSAGTITVNTLADEHLDNASCSLREAIIAANIDASYFGCVYSGSGGHDIITLTSGQTYTLTRVGAGETTGDLDIFGDLTIQASGTTNAIINANGINRAIEAGELGDVDLTLINITITNGLNNDGGGISFAGGGTLTLQNSAVLNNVATGSQNCGAGIYNNSPATVVINNSTIAGNSCTEPSSDGGGLYKNGGGSVTITNSTFSGNTVGDNGGGANFDTLGGTVTIRNSTFANNTAGGRGGGIQVANGTVTIEFSTFSGNAANISTGTTSIGGAVQATGGSVEIRRSILANSTTSGVAGQDCDQFAPGEISVTNSIVEINSDCSLTNTSNADPGLGALANNGGPTMTMAITNASPAYDAATTCTPVSTDQRGVSRPQGASCDLGAFEVFVTTSAPGKATQVSPSGSITNNKPTFTWNEVAGATWYYLWVQGPSGPVIQQWYSSTQANCGGGTCSVVSPKTLVNGAHGWWVQTYNNLGYGPWSDGLNFSVTPPPPPGKATQVSPSGSIGTTTPTFTWNEVSAATWYYLWVQGPSGPVIQQWYSSAQANCGGGTCSVVSPKTLSAGAHGWWVQTYSSAGYGPWSDGLNFSVTPPPPPGKATQVSPSGSITNTTPTFTWNEVSGATWYYLWVQGPSGPVIQQWVSSTQANCGGGTCSVVSPKALSAGAHSWWVQTYSSAGYGPWSDGLNFSVTLPPPPGKATLVSPSGSIGSNTPTFTWNEVSGATWYYMWISGPSGNAVKQWYSSAQANCGGGTCSVASPATLNTGSHTWWIQTYNNAGYGPWSDGLSFTTP